MAEVNLVSTFSERDIIVQRVISVAVSLTVTGGSVLTIQQQIVASYIHFLAILVLKVTVVAVQASPSAALHGRDNIGPYDHQRGLEELTVAPIRVPRVFFASVHEIFNDLEILQPATNKNRYRIFSIALLNIERFYSKCSIYLYNPLFEE